MRKGRREAAFFFGQFKSGGCKVIGAPMKIESTAILYLGVMFFLAILLCKTFEVVIERARKFFANGSDYIDPVKTELNTLNSKTDALRIKFESKLDVLKKEINALKTEIDALKSKAESVATTFSAVSDSPTPMPEDSDTWTRDMRVTEASIVPMIPSSASDDTWTRDAVSNQTGDNANAEKKTHPVELANPPSLQPGIGSSARQWKLPQVLID